MKRLISTLLAFLLALQLIPIVFAAEPICQVSTLEELETAIAEATENDTIQLMQTITVDHYTVIGDMKKTVTICGADTLSTFFHFTTGPSEYTAIMMNIIIDGSGSTDGSKVEIEGAEKVTFDTVIWKDCQNCVNRGEGGALNISVGSAELISCSFNNCRAIRGGGVYTALGILCLFSDCTFTQNTAESLGGAICATGISEIKNCTFNDNSSEYIGGAVGGVDMIMANCKFAGNNAQYAGALTCFSGNAHIQGCTFSDNSAEQSGGAIMIESLSAEFSGNTVFNNHAAETGGGLYLRESIILEDNKIYGNTADIFGADITCSKSLTICVNDYVSLFQAELNEGNYDSMAWFLDDEGCRYSPEAPTDIFPIDKFSGMDNPLELESTALTFVMWEKSVDSDLGETPGKEPDPDDGALPSGPPIQEEEPTKPPAQTDQNNSPPILPGPPNTNTPIHRPNHTTDTTSPVSQPDISLILSCDKAIIDMDSLKDYISALNTLPLKYNMITRAEMAHIIYGLLEENSRRNLEGHFKIIYPDLSDSPYRDEVNALTYAGVFCGDSSGNFKPSSPLTFGQLLTILTRFATDSQLDTNQELTSLAQSTHWAKPAAQAAFSNGWIDDLPFDLEAYVTYGTLKTIFERIAK